VSSSDEIERFLFDYPQGIRAKAEALQALVLGTVPDAVPRLRPGWRLIGFDVPARRGLRYFAYVAPEPEHVHLGFEHGTLVPDPRGLLQGAHLNLRKVRYLTYRVSDQVPEKHVAELIRHAASLAQLGPGVIRALREQKATEPPP
jgi:hypothetical protein